jgi:hypothetical protein
MTDSNLGEEKSEMRFRAEALARFVGFWKGSCGYRRCFSNLMVLAEEGKV